MRRYLPLILKSGFRNRRRTILTIASISVSFCLLGTLLAMYRAMFFGEDTTPAQALRLVTHHKVSLVLDLPVSYEQEIRSLPGVRAVTKLRWFGGTYKGTRDARNRFAQFAVEPGQLFEVHPEYKIDEAAKRGFLRNRTACIATDTLAQKLGWKQGERITLVNDAIPATLELTLAGAYQDPAGKEMLYLNWDYLSNTVPAGSKMRGEIQQYHLIATSKEDVNRVAKAIDALFDNSPAPTKTENERAFELSFVNFLGNLKLFLAAICGALAFTILFVSANTVSMSVRDRVREVGVLKTLGFTNSAILGMILGEAALSALIGGAIGCALAGALCSMVRQGPAFALFIRTLGMTPSVTALSLGLACLIGVTSALVPAMRASRASIVDSLRFSG